MFDAPAELLGQLIAVPSVNPLLAVDGDREPGEGQMTEWLCRYCDQRGWRRLRQEVHSGRTNVVALVPGDSGKTILWDVHQDTVSTAGMTVDAFQARTTNGRIYGRGACDVKGAMAAMLCAASSACRDSAARRPNLLLSFTVNEECGFTGAAALARLWQDEPGALARNAATDPNGALTLDELRTLRPSSAVVAEPTSLDVVVAHRGVVRWRCRTIGRAAHSSQPQHGRNAISAMAEIVRLVDRFHADTLSGRVDSLCGASTAVVTTIHGGTGPNTVPDETIVDIDRQLLPNESVEDAYRELVEVVDGADKHGCQIQHDSPWMQSHGLTDAQNRDWAEAVAGVVRAGGADSRVIGVPYGTNAATIADTGIPTVVFGPGSIEQAHTADEWIDVEQLELAADLFARIASGAAAL